jgi:CRISPR-associated protein Csd2
MQITKSVNSEPSETKSSDTMGTKHFVEFGLYKIKGSINVQLAEKTGFSEEDAEKIKEALRTLFINDASSARPDGSMEVVKVYWWRHNNKIGQYSSAKVHDLLKVSLKDDVMIPASIDDYSIELGELPDLKPEIIEGI